MENREIKMQTLYKRLKRAKGNLKELVEGLQRYDMEYPLSRMDKSDLMIEIINYSVKLIEEFNNFDLGHKLNEVNLSKYFEDLSISKICSIGWRIREEISIAIDILEEISQPSLSSVEKDTINQLKDELSELEALQLNPIIAKNLLESVNEIESKHFTACGLISSRIILYIIEKIQGKDFDSKIENLKELEIIDKSEKAKETQKFFLDASKSARDAMVHKIDYLPSSSEAINILSSAFRISRLFTKYTEKIKLT